MSAQLEDCVLCCREIQIYATGACDHPVCYECSTRMRVLCETNECPICRSDMPAAVFTHTKKAFQDVPKKIPNHLLNKKYQIFFQDEIILEAFEKLLENRCKCCKEVFPTFEKLNEHVRRKHEFYYCDLCTNSLKIFTFERKFYSRKDLARHKRTGDPDETSHRGHPICEFCDFRYIDNDELFRHLRREHFFCHFCDADGKNQYYKDYEYLRTHFRKDHHLCEEGECINEKFTAVFRSDIDLKAHIAVHHWKNKSRKEVKQARLLEFEFAPPPRHPGSSSPRGGRYGQRRRNDENNPRDRNKAEVPPEVESLDTQSVQDFPYLSGDITSKPNQANSSSLDTKLQSSLNLQSYSKKLPAMSVEEFPALGSSTSRDVPQNENKPTNNINMNQYNSALQAAAVSLQAKRTASSNANKKSLSENGKSNKPKQKANKWTGNKESPMFEEDFPSLEVRSKPQPVKFTIPITNPTPSESKSNLIKDVTTDSYGDQFVTIKGKPKKKQSKPPVVQVTEKEKQTHNFLSPREEPSEPENQDKFTKHLINSLERNKPPTSKMSDCWSEEASFGREDFPPLASSEKPPSKKPPPGLSVKKTRAPPPGFSQIRPKTEPTPTMENLLSSMRERFMASQNKQNGNDQSSSNIPSDEEDEEEKNTYITPPKYEFRSAELIKKVFELTGDNPITFNNFKRVSGKFRNEAITAKEYYSQCLDILGTKFLDVFPELISLLPDIKMQQDLLTVHNRYSGQKDGGAISKKMSSNEVVSCNVCSQVLSQSDCKSHAVSHVQLA